MARTAITAQVVTPAGIVPSYGAVDQANGNAFDNVQGDRVLHVKNGGGVSLTVTILTPATLEGEEVAERTVTVAAGAEKIIGPFSRRVFNQADSAVYVDWSVGASITAAVLQVTS